MLIEKHALTSELLPIKLQAPVTTFPLDRMPSEIPSDIAWPTSDNYDSRISFDGVYFGFPSEQAGCPIAVAETTATACPKAPWPTTPLIHSPNPVDLLGNRNSGLGGRASRPRFKLIIILHTDFQIEALAAKYNIVLYWADMIENQPTKTWVGVDSFFGRQLEVTGPGGSPVCVLIWHPPPPSPLS